jgi:hypothetical protein
MIEDSVPGFQPIDELVVPVMLFAFGLLLIGRIGVKGFQTLINSGVGWFFFCVHKSPNGY